MLKIAQFSSLACENHRKDITTEYYRISINKQGKKKKKGRESKKAKRKKRQNLEAKKKGRKCDEQKIRKISKNKIRFCF